MTKHILIFIAPSLATYFNSNTLFYRSITCLNQCIQMKNEPVNIATDKRGIHIIVFLFLDENICCGYSLEVPW